MLNNEYYQHNQYVIHNVNNLMIYVMKMIFLNMSLDYYNPIKQEKKKKRKKKKQEHVNKSNFDILSLQLSLTQ